MFYEAIIGSTMHTVLLLHLTNITYNYDAAHALILFHYFQIFFRYHFIFQATL